MPTRNRSSRRRATSAASGDNSKGSITQPIGTESSLSQALASPTVESASLGNGGLPASEALVCAACPAEHEEDVVRICRARKIMRAFESSHQRSTRGPWSVSEWLVAVQVAVVGMVEQHDAGRARILCVEDGKTMEEQMGNQHRLLQAIRSNLGQASFPIRMEWLPFEEFAREFGECQAPSSRIPPKTIVSNDLGSIVGPSTPTVSASTSASTAATSASEGSSNTIANATNKGGFCKGKPPNRVPGMGGKGASTAAGGAPVGGGAGMGIGGGGGGGGGGGQAAETDNMTSKGSGKGSAGFAGGGAAGGKGASGGESQGGEKGRGRHRSSSRRGRSRNSSSRPAERGADAACPSSSQSAADANSNSNNNNNNSKGFLIVDERSNTLASKLASSAAGGNTGNNNNNNSNNTSSTIGNTCQSSAKNSFMAPARSSPPVLPAQERGTKKAAAPAAAIRSPTPGISPWADPYSDLHIEEQLQYQGSSNRANPPKLPKEKMEQGPPNTPTPETPTIVASPVADNSQEAWPDLMTAANTPMPGASRLRNRSATRTQQPSQPRSASVRGLSQSRMRGMQSRRDPVMVMWNCRECGQQFQGQDLLLDHQESEGHWGPTLEASCSKTLVRKWESRSKQTPSTPGADSGNTATSDVDVGGAECFSLISPRGSDAENENEGDGRSVLA